MSTPIRVAVPDDIAAILAIEQASPGAAHWTGDQYERRIRAGFIIVAEREGTIRGFLCFHAVAGDWEIENVVVTPESRRGGIGAALMELLIKQWEAAGGTALLLEVRESNAAARALYEKSGLREAGRRRDYYRDPVEDAVLYVRHGQGRPQENFD